MKFCSLALAAVLFLLAACTTPPPPTPLPLVPTVTPAADPTADWVSIYFSAPDSPAAETYRGGPDAALAEAIRAARLSVDMAAYDLNLWSLRDALLAAQRSGVSVRLVVESDNLDRPEIQGLVDAGIAALGDRRESLMHNKFVVIDGLEVWSGSMNFTLNGAYHNDNNLIRLRSAQLAENYTAEFEEMFVRDMFGDNVVRNTPHPRLEIFGVPVQTWFSPDDGAAAAIVAAIESAEESIYFLAFSFTSDEIAGAMLAAQSRGVEVAGVFEASQVRSNMGSEFERLAQAGLAVRLDGNPDNMHHKVIVIDEEIVITGSYNFSRSAEESNDENLLILHNASIAAQYLAEFERVFSLANE